MKSNMLAILLPTTLAGAALLALVDAAAKSFVLLALAVVMCLALRRASAATRHLIWLSTLAATLALPVLSFWLPQWRVLPEWMDVTSGSRGTEPFVAALPPIAILPDHSQAEPLPAGDQFPPADQFPPMDEATQQALQSLRESGVDPSEALTWGLLGLIRLAAVSLVAVLATGLLIVWGIGAVVLLVPMVRSAWRLHRLASSLPLVTFDPQPVGRNKSAQFRPAHPTHLDAGTAQTCSGLPLPLAKATHDVARELGIPAPLLYLGSAGAMPMVWGMRRGRLLLPADAMEWGAVRLRAVLLHELAHLRRRDPLTQAVAQVARALHWFNPLAWLALRNLRVEQERACDDYVLRGGVKPSDYAGHVLELATQLQPAPRAASLALAMADRTRIEGRLQTILDAARSRRALSRWLVAATMLVVGSVTFSLAMLQAADGKKGDSTADTSGVETVTVPVGAARQARPRDAEFNTPLRIRLIAAVDGSLASDGIVLGDQPINGMEALEPELKKIARDPKGVFEIVIEADASLNYQHVVQVVTAVSQAGFKKINFKSSPEDKPHMRIRLVAAVDGSLASDGIVLSDRPMNGIDALEKELKKLASDPKGVSEIVIEADASLKYQHLVQVVTAVSHAGFKKINFKSPSADTPQNAGEQSRRRGAEKRDSPASTPPYDLQPKNKEAQVLFKKWQDSSRTNGKIPGGALGSLARAVANFIKLNPTHEGVPKLTELLKRIDTSHDWTQADAVALLNDLTDIYPTLPAWAIGNPIRPGTPLPAELSGAAWGQPAANGLRAAWLLEPATAQHRLGENLKSRILFHNTGKETVVFRTPDWHQYAAHQARDGNGAVINVSATEWTRLTTLVTIRLAPGEYAEVEAHAIGVFGRRDKGEENRAGLRIGAWIEAKEGDEVTFLSGAVDASPDLLAAPPDRMTPAEMWKATVKERIEREGPMPASAADREQLIRRVTPDLIGVPPTQQEIAAFTADNSRDALSSLVERLVPRVAPFAGDLPAGEITFRVLPADPDAVNRPRVVSNPGWYTLGDNIVLSVTRRPVGERIVNEASIRFFSPDPKVEPPAPVSLKLPDGYSTWAAAWLRGGTVLWVAQKGLVRKYDFANPAQVTETRFEPGSIVDVPEQFRDVLKAALDVPAAPKPAPAAPAAPKNDENEEAEQSEQSRLIGAEDKSPLIDFDAVGPTLARLQEIESDEDFVRQAYRDLLARDATVAEVEAFLKETNKRGSLMLDLASKSNRFGLTPEKILGRLDATHWDIPQIDSPLVIARFTKQAQRRTGGAIIPDLLIYENGCVVIPAGKGRAGNTGQLTAAELQELRQEITDKQQFFAIAPLRTIQDAKNLNEGKTDSYKINAWSTGSLQIWVRGPDRWHTVHSFLYSWIYGRERTTWPDEIKRLHAIDERLLQVRERAVSARREVNSKTSDDVPLKRGSRADPASPSQAGKQNSPASTPPDEPVQQPELKPESRSRPARM